MACFIKSGPGSSERADPGTKIHFIGSRFIFHKFEGSDFKYDSRFLKLLSKNTQDIFGTNFRLFLFFFFKILHSDKFQNANFKYDNSFITILAPKYPNQTFFFPNLGIFGFAQNFAVRLIRGHFLQI